MMLVEHVQDAARRRLATLKHSAPVADAAEILMNPNTPLVLICDGEGVAVGVISRTDILRTFARAKADAFTLSADAVMSRCVFSCHTLQPLQDIWKIMTARSLRCAPVLDNDGRPQGVLHARDVASALLEEVTNEETLLRDYVLGIGYQ